MKILLVVGILLLSSSCIVIPSQAKTGSSKVSAIYPSAYFFGSNLASYSVNYNDSSSVINFYVIYKVSSFLHLVNGSSSIGNETVYPISDFINPSSNIIQLKYYISNNTKFIALSSYNADNYSLDIFDLNTNQSITFQGNTSYRISLINTFNNSPDVYFSFSNNTQFSIIKYNFADNNFTIFYQTKNLNLLYHFISNVNVFYYQNRIYSSLDIYNNSVYNSSILVFNKSTSIFNRTFYNFYLDFFTPTDAGFLLHSVQDTYFYDYRFIIDKYSRTNINFPFIGSLRPFSNNSFIYLASNNLYKGTIDLLSNPSIISFSEFSSIDGYDLNLNAFHLTSGNYYIIGGNNNSNNYVVSINTEFDFPDGFSPLPTTTTTTTTNPYSQYGTVTTQYAVTTTAVSSSALSIFFLILVIVFGIVGFALYSYNQKNKNRYYPPRDNSYLHRSNNTIQNYNTNASKPLANSLCSSCGSITEPSDIFCQNCGSRL